MERMETIKAELKAQEDAMATAIADMSKGGDSAVKAKATHDAAAKAFDALMDEAKAIRDHAERISRQRGIEAQVASKSSQAEVPTIPAAAKDVNGDERQRMEWFLDYMCGKSLSGQAMDAMRPRSPKLAEADAKAITVPDAAFVSVMGASASARVIGMERTARAMGKTMTSDDMAGGGNMVAPNFVAELQKLPYPMATLFDRVTMRPAPGGNIIYPVMTQTDANEFGGMTWAWKTEGSEKPNTDAKFDQVKIECHEICGYTEVSNTMLRRSAIDIPALIGELGRAGLRTMIDAAIVNGTGINQPLGIIPAVGVRIVDRLVAGEVNDDDLVNLKHAVRPMHRGNSMYVLGDDVEQGLELKKDAMDRPLFRASTATGPYDRLVGYPYAIGMNQPAIGVTGDIMFGNPATYILAVDAEITIAQSAHYRFANNVTAFVMYANVGGRPIQPRAWALLGQES